MQVDLSSFDNSDFRPGSRLKRSLWYFFNILFLLNPWNPFIGLKRAVLRMFGAKIGKGVVIKPRVNIKYPWMLTVGDYSWIGEGVWIDNLGKVDIGENVCISQGALLLSGNHNYKKPSFDLMVGEIKLDDGVWIGAKSIVPGGTKAASHSILTAGSIASSKLKAYGIYKGNPAEWIRERKIMDND